jgi:hypothetical protein
MMDRQMGLTAHVTQHIAVGGDLVFVQHLQLSPLLLSAARRQHRGD